MKKFFSVLMMALSLLIGFQQAVIVIHFKASQAIIEQTLCVNRNSPDVQCHGACYLKKQLQKTQHAGSPSVSIYHRVDVLSGAATEFDATRGTIVLTNTITLRKATRYTEPCRKIFVPPPIG